MKPLVGAAPWVMAIVNVTPDSFSDDGIHQDVAAVVERATAFMQDGAAILDVGGESTRPDSTAVSQEVELARVIPAIEGLVKAKLRPISVDTSKSVVADAALSAGAAMLNDVSGLRDEELAAVAARHGVPIVVMHNGWNLPPRDLGSDIVLDVARELHRLVDCAVRAGVPAERVIADPGLGFGKDVDENLELMRRLRELRQHLAPAPLLVGPSRKRFIGAVLDLPPGERVEGTLACVALAVSAGVEFVRVHDVRASVRVARMTAAMRVPLR